MLSALLAAPDVMPAFERAWTIIRDRVNGWAEAAIASLPNLAVAVVLVVAFGLIARGLAKLVDHTLRRTGVAPPLRHLVVSTLRAAVAVTGLFVALGILGLDKTVTSLLAGVGILGLALGFAFQDIAENFIAGIFLSIRRPFAEGDVVETNDYMGVVDHLDLRTTVLRTFQGQHVRIPNSDVFQNPLMNYSVTGSRRVDLSVGVSYGDDLEKARRVAIEAVEGVEGRDEARDVELFYEGFGGSSIDVQIRFWIPFGGQTDFLRARSDAIVRVKAAFDREGVSIPFPIRTLDFSDVGGERLDEVLARRSGSAADGGDDPPAAPA